ncbi:MAG TPA: DUF2914 domain-containing protein [Candidatus Polarisedimenticolia bacterium]|nr:DUF2914 domain-containing protein [Candidatus Polarisedimenticolia bacterium]
MQGPGQSLRQAREAHGKTLEEMSEATGIRLPFLTALEGDAFDSLPGRGFGKLYIRAYAEVLGFDPRPVIEAYDSAVPPIEDVAPTSEPAPGMRPVNAVLSAWRRELIAKRAEADPSVSPEESIFDEAGSVEDEAVPGRTAGPARTVPLAEHARTVPLAQPARTVPQTATPSRAARSLFGPGAALLLLVLLPAVAYLVSSRSRSDRSPVDPRPEQVPGKTMAAPPGDMAAPPKATAVPPSLPRPPQAVEAPRTPAPAPSPGEPATSSSLEVAESGIGLRLVGGRLEGEGDRFHAGQRVTFATRVQGGAAGGHISHVWLRDGKVEQSIRLRLGGASWRTWSTKTLGRPGAWAVEARDEQGRVLARADLTVAP